MYWVDLSGLVSIKNPNFEKESFKKKFFNLYSNKEKKSVKTKLIQYTLSNSFEIKVEILIIYLHW